MISAYVDEMVSSYPCQRNNSAPTPDPKLSPLSRARLQMPSVTRKPTEIGIEDLTKRHLPSGVEKSEKLYAGANFVIKCNVTVAKSISLSGPQAARLRHGRAELDDRHGSFTMLFPVRLTDYFFI